MPVTEEEVRKYVNTNDEWTDIVVEDILAIVNDNKKYPPRGNTEEFRIPEDISTGIAKNNFGVDAYKTENCNFI